MRLALLRHGPTGWNKAGRIQGRIDIPLSPEGRAKMAGLRLPPPLEGRRIFVSPSLRARQTAQALGLHNPHLDVRLVEQDWGRWEGLSRDGILARDGPDAFVMAGSTQGEAFRPPGGESTGELHARVADFLRDVARGAGNAVAVTHLGVLRAAYTLATHWGMDAPMPPDLDVSRILVLNLAADGTPAIAELNVDFGPRDAAS